MMKKVLRLIACLFCSLTSYSQSTSLHEDFSSCSISLPSGWLRYSVSGSETWQCSASGQSGNGIQMNGYSGGSANDNEDWLISPLLDLNNYADPVLSFWCRTKYSGPFIQVLISDNYSGSGNPNGSTWTNLSVTLPTSNSDVWFLSDQINLNSFKNQPFRIAFKYLSTSSLAATWRLDEVNINDGNLILPTKFINTGESANSVASNAHAVNFTMNGVISTFSAEVSTPFEISKDGISYSQQLTYTPAIAGITQTFYVRLLPPFADKVYRKRLQFKLNGNVLAEGIDLLGTTLPDTACLKMVSWNMRWFGDPSSCACDTNEARINAIRIMKDIDADIYCLQEVVANQQIANITSELGTKYNYIVSPFCSFASSPSGTSYATGQKLAFIYNTEKIENLGSFGLLASTYPSDSSSNSAYYCFASGRFPFVLKAKLKLHGGITDTLIFANIHAKASSDLTSYNRRQCAVTKMTDSLNTLFPGMKIVVIGDFNDYLEGTPVSGATQSPYKYLLDNGFTGITLPSKYPNQSTFVGSNNHIIDNLAISNNLVARYPDSSCIIFDETERYIADYGSTTSDHIPLIGYLKFSFAKTLGTEQHQQSDHLFDLVNPSDGYLQLHLSHDATRQHMLLLHDLTGNLICKELLNSTGPLIGKDLRWLQSGLYFVTIRSGQMSHTMKWIKE